MSTEQENAVGPSELERMVKEAGIHNVGSCGDCGLTMYQLGRLVIIAASAEREACATEAERMMLYPDGLSKALWRSIEKFKAGGF